MSGLCLEPHCAAQHVDAADDDLRRAAPARPPASTVCGATMSVADEAAVVLAGGHRVWVGVNGRFVYVFAAGPRRHRGVPASAPLCRTATALVLVTAPGPGQCAVAAARHRARLACFAAQETAPRCSLRRKRSDDTRVERLARDRDGLLGRNRAFRSRSLAWRSASAWSTSTRRAQHTTCGSPRLLERGDGRPRGAFLYQRPELQGLLTQFSRTGGRFRVLDPDGWVLSDAGRVEPQSTATARGSLIPSAFLRWALRRDDPPYPPERPVGRVGDPDAAPRARGRARPRRGTGSGPDREAIVAAAVPIAGPQGPQGAVLLEQASNPILTLTDSKRSRR